MLKSKKPWLEIIGWYSRGEYSSDKCEHFHVSRKAASKCARRRGLAGNRVGTWSEKYYCDGYWR